MYEKLSVTGKKWNMFQASVEKLIFFSQTLKIPENQAILLLWRGLKTLDEVHSYLNPTIKKSLGSPFDLTDMQKATKRLFHAYQKKEKIAIFGDYDVDGATSSALLKKFFQYLDIPHVCYIPDRLKEGYGPSKKAFSYLRNIGCTLIITVDCGTTFSETHSIDLDVIILDHHQPPNHLPQTYALINPKRKDQKTDHYTNLAAVGVTFLFIIACCHVLKQKNVFQLIAKPPLIEWLDLVALGTVCDMVPLIGLNRTFVKQGLKIISQSKNLGIKILWNLCNIIDKPKASHLAFYLGPLINAGGRLGKSNLGSDLLATNNIKQAQRISAILQTCNEERKILENTVWLYAQQYAQNQNGVIFISGNFHLGIIGIIAGKLKEKFNKPSIIISYDNHYTGKGSARSINDFHIGKLILQAINSGLLISGGGHAMAAGFTISRDQEKNFLNFLNNQYNNIDTVPIINIAQEITISAIDNQLMYFLEELEPFGFGAKDPIFLFRNVSIVHLNILKDKHLKLIIKQKTIVLNALLFYGINTILGDVLQNIFYKKEKIHLIGTLHNKYWMQKHVSELIILDAMILK